ncbi:MAG: hypothetical protein CR986_10190 [Ignavibacteriae bacterium]|nr:MAG: hypothetical protein CR986_10190 [Ignavibacteriota bacterium]
MIKLTKLQEKRRSDIINSATELFAENGFHSVDMDKIKQKAKVAKATLYSYFNSKEELYFVCVDNSYDVLFKNISSYTKKANTVDEFLSLLVDAILEIHTKITSTINLMGRINHEMLIEVFQIIEEKKKKYLNDEFKKKLELLSTKDLNPNIVFSTIWVSCSYLIYRLNIAPIGNLEEIKTNLLNLFLNGLKIEV